MHPRRSRSGHQCGMLVAFAAAAPGFGQLCAPGWSEGFANAPRIDNLVAGLAIFDDGGGPRLYAAGYFSEASGRPAGGIVVRDKDRWVEVGGGVAPITPIIGSTGVRWLGVLDDGTGPALYLAGNFTHAGGQPARSVAKWDGTSWSAFGPGFNADMRALTVFDDGSGPSLYAAGLFTQSGSIMVRGVARWNGASWQPLGAGVTAPPGTPAPGARSLGVFDLGDGPKLYVGGRFTQAGGAPANSIARWDGRQWSPVGDGLYGTDFVSQVGAMMLFDHGSGPQLTIGGRFSLTPAGDLKPRVARWTGAQWIQVGPDLGSASPTAYVTSLVVFPGPSGPELYAGGWFSEGNWLSQQNYIVRFRDGEWTPVGGGMAYGVQSLLVADEQGGPAMYACGAFDFAGQTPASRVARWNGESWSGFEQGGLGLAPSGARAMAVFDDGGGERVYVGGYFRAAGDLMCNSIAAWDGRAWHNLGDGVRELSGMFGYVNALKVHDDGSGPALYATGNFDVAGEGPCFNIARWNGGAWSAPGGNGIDGPGYALETFEDPAGPALYVAGIFQYASAATARGIARWNGSAWSGLGNGATLESGQGISALRTFDDGSGDHLYAGGHFSSIGGVPAACVARWDGSMWSAVGGGFSGAPPAEGTIIFDLQTFDDGSGAALYAAGRFGSVAGSPGQLVARWNGATWQPVPLSGPAAPQGGEAYALIPFDDGTAPALFVGGRLALAGVPGAWAGLLRLQDGSWSSPGAGVGSPANAWDFVYAGASWHIDDRPVLMVTGVFAEAGSVRSDHVAEWRGCPGCYADCDHNAALTIADFACFQAKFVESDPYADCNQDAQFTITDFGCFQTSFAAGCP